MSEPVPSVVPEDRRVRVLGRPVDSHPLLQAVRGNGAVLRITEVGESVLHRPCADVTGFGTSELASLIDDMFVTMYVADGVGLAANQVGVNLRLFVYDCRDDQGCRHVGYVCNPVVEFPTGKDRQLVEHPEACLSVPGGYHDLWRYDRAVVHGQDMEGEPLRIEGTGFFARCLQHETDHVNGLLYIDRLTKKERRAALRRMEQGRASVMATREEKAAALGK